ncbi:hypothetical protein D3C84_509120 [compost metagenome]
MAAFQLNLFVLAAYGHVRPVGETNTSFKGAGTRSVGDGRALWEEHSTRVQQALAIPAPNQPT